MKEGLTCSSSQTEQTMLRLFGFREVDAIVNLASISDFINY